MGCRTSKVKCEPCPEDEGKSDVCKRCARLGLHCIYTESRRGQPSKSRDVARLGPAVRALLRTTQPSPVTEPVVAEIPSGYTTPETLEPPSAAHASVAGDIDECILSWEGNTCQKHMVQSITTREGQIALLKHWLLIGVRSGSCGMLPCPTCAPACCNLWMLPQMRGALCSPDDRVRAAVVVRPGLLGNVLILAHSLSVALDAFTLKIETSLPAAALPPTPHFVAEWFNDAQRVCCIRRQVEGDVAWEPNQTFVSTIGDEPTLQARLAAFKPGVAGRADFLTCTAEMFLASALHPSDQQHLANLNSQLWSSLSTPSADGTQTAEATAPTPVRCMGPSSNSGEAPSYQVYTLQARTVVARDSRAVFSAFSLLPTATLSTEAPLEWPADELVEAMMHANEDTREPEPLEYCMLEVLGMQLEAFDRDNTVPGN